MKFGTIGLAAAILATGARAGAAQTTGSSTPPAQTQSPPQTPTVKEKVEVITSRIPLPPHDVPASVEVIDGQTLRNMGATTLREALSLAAGVEIGPGSDAGPAGAVPEFWGLREQDAFLLVVDGIPWGGAFNPDLTTLNLRDIERIEILRGSAPVTYGATSFVGVINIIHKASAATTSYGSARFGSFSSGGGAADFAIHPAAGWNTRLSVDGERLGFSDPRTSFSRGHTLYRGSKETGDSRTWFSVDFNYLNQQPASPHVREGAALSTATPLDANYNPDGAFLDNNRLTAQFGVERPLSNSARWSLNGSYSHSGQQLFRGFLTDVSNTANNATGFRENIDINDLYTDFHVTWPSISHMRVLAGGDFLFGNGEGHGATFTYTVPIDGTTPTKVTEPTDLNLDTGSRREFGGAYVSGDYLPTTWLTLSAGIRLNLTAERHGEGATVSHVKPSGTLGVLASVWEHGANHVKLFADYRNTFKPAAFDFSLAENEGVLEPETAQSYEGGLKAQLAQGRVTLEASGFRMNFENLVTPTVVDGLPSLQNTGSTRFQGFETAGELHLPHAVTGRATYSFHDARFVDFAMDFGDGVNTQLAGKRFEMSARHLASGGLIYAPASGLIADVIVKYVGSRYLNKRNTALAEAFATVDLGVGYRHGRWEVRMTGSNLTNRRDAISESELGDAQYYRMTARRFDVSLGVHF